ETVGDFDADAALPGVACHPRASVGLVVERARQPGHEPPWNQLANEADAPPFTAADVEPQVDLGKSHEARPLDAEHARLDEIEGDQADEGGAVAQIERAPGWKIRLE